MSQKQSHHSTLRADRPILSGRFRNYLPLIIGFATFNLAAIALIAVCLKKSDKKAIHFDGGGRSRRQEMKNRALGKHKSVVGVGGDEMSSSKTFEMEEGLASMRGGMR